MSSPASDDLLEGVIRSSPFEFAETVQAGETVVTFGEVVTYESLLSYAGPSSALQVQTDPGEVGEPGDPAQGR